MSLEYVREEVDEIINNYSRDREMAHIREDNFVMEFLKYIKTTLEDKENKMTFEEFKSETISKISLILEMHEKTEDDKWYA